MISVDERSCGDYPMRRIERAALVALAVVGGAAVIDAQPSVSPKKILYAPGAQRDTCWHWIEVETSDDGWHVTRGIGNVQLSGRNFSADLQLNPHEPTGANIQLRGSVERGAIRATEILLNTDASPVAISGTIQTQPHGDMLAQRITFRGGPSGEASYLSLYRLTPAR